MGALCLCQPLNGGAFGAGSWLGNRSRFSGSGRDCGKYCSPVGIGFLVVPGLESIMISFLVDVPTSTVVSPFRFRTENFLT